MKNDEFISITSLPKNIVEYKWLNSLEDLKKLADRFNKPIFLKVNAIDNINKEVSKKSFGILNVVEKQIWVRNGNTYFIEVEEKNGKVLYGFFNLLATKKFDGICAFCNQELKLEDAFTWTLNNWIGFFHRKCSDTIREDWNKEAINFDENKDTIEQAKKLLKKLKEKYNNVK